MNRSMVVVIGLIVLACGTALSAPRWVNQRPVGRNHVYAVGVGECTTNLSDARKASIASAMQAFDAAQGVTLSSRTQLTKIEDSTSYRESVIDEIDVRGVSATLTGLQLVETYVARSSSPYRVWALMSMPSENQISYWSPVWRSTLIPGWGQFYQGKSFRGGMMLLAEAVAVGGAAYCAESYVDRVSKANSATSRVSRSEYNKQADSFYQLNVICLSAAAVVYGLNLADVLVMSNNFSDIYYSAYVHPDTPAKSGSIGVAVSVPVKLFN